MKRPNPKSLYTSLILIVFMASTSTVLASDVLHRGIWTYTFGNHLDTHQESRQVYNGDLIGLLYIIYTGDIDAETGLPVARHPRGSSHNEVCGVDPIDCLVGWTFTAKQASAKFLFHAGVNGDDHPVWLINRVDIPQPGAYSHFHWIANQLNGTTDSRGSAISADCDKNMASQLETQEPTAINDVCDGWFIRLIAIREFVFEHGGEKITIRRGNDNSSHLNLVTNYAEVNGITPTRGNSNH